MSTGGMSVHVLNAIDASAAQRPVTCCCCCCCCCCAAGHVAVTAAVALAQLQLSSGRHVLFDGVDGLHMQRREGSLGLHTTKKIVCKHVHVHNRLAIYGALHRSLLAPAAAAPLLYMKIRTFLCAHTCAWAPLPVRPQAPPCWPPLLMQTPCLKHAHIYAHRLMHARPCPCAHKPSHAAPHLRDTC